MCINEIEIIYRSLVNNLLSTEREIFSTVSVSTSRVAPIINKLNCSCGKISNSQVKPTCESEECFKPYCIGSDRCDKSISKCSDDQLYQCTGNSIDDPNFVSYMYIDNSILSLYSNLLTLQELFSPEKKNNILIYLFIFITIILVIFGVLYLLKKNKKRK